ncbi:MAG: S1C family serine protease [Halodesulfurarchaeum sp.]
MRSLVPVVVLSLIVGLTAGGAIGMTVQAPDGTGPQLLEAPGSTPAQASAQPTTSNYTELYRETIESVVKIRVDTALGRAQGSGFVYDRSHVVTNQHVVANASTVLVQFSDGVWRTGQVIGTDVYTDLAVVRVENMPADATPLPVARTEPHPGQPVAALGSPFGLEGTITHGIVSGVNRSMRVEGGFSIPDTVQTDAPINPGNSGGPLVSMSGTVVGLNRAKEGDNVGFAISSSVIRRVVPELIDDGEYEHSYMGIRTIPVTPQIARERGMEQASGLVVVRTVSGTPAAGVFQTASVSEHGNGTGPIVTGGDVIVGIDGRQVHTNQELSRYLMLHTHPGEVVSVTVIREGSRETVKLELGERPPS